jgi:glycosyltransferase involved in cell wall biosynthesis
VGHEEADVCFLGFQQNPFRYLSRAMAFVLPSVREGFPNVLVEAMACGLPVAAADCQTGPREILAPSTDATYQTLGLEAAEYGLLLPQPVRRWSGASEALTEQEECLSGAIVRLCGDSGVRRAYAAAAKLRSEDFSVERLLPEWKRLINSAVANR